MSRPVPALSDLSVTEFLTLNRVGFVPHGLVIGASVYDAGGDTGGNLSFWDALAGNNPTYQTAEVASLSQAMRAARSLAIFRMRSQAANLRAEGVVGVRLTVEHHRWRGGHQVAKFVAMGSAVAAGHHDAPDDLRGAPSLRLASGAPFTSDLSGQDFVALLRAGFRPITVATGTCVYQLDAREVARYAGYSSEITSFTQAFFDARETAMARLQHDLFTEFPPGHPDAPTGIVGMTVEESARNDTRMQGPPVIEFTAIGTAVAPLHPKDPRRSLDRPKPRIVVPLDR